MPQKAPSMRKIKEVLRLRYDLGLLQNEIALSCSISQSSVNRYLERASAAGLSWPLPEDCDDRRLKELLFPAAPADGSPPARAPLDCAAIHHQLQSNKHVTLQLLWEEYRQSQPEGYRYSRFCELYQRWRRKQDVVLRQEPSKVLIAVAAYTGLRRGEIVGLQWGDYDGKKIWVRRNICFGEKGEMSVELPKTEASEAPVPVIAPLRRILDAWKAKAKVTEGCWIFQAGFTRKQHPESLLDAAKLSLVSPQNVLRDVIAPALEKAKIEWYGFHGFRRGLATNLRSLGVDDLTIKEILRHSDVSVTRASYIKRIDEKSVQAMDKLEAELRKPVRSVKGKARKADTVVPVGMA